MKFAKIVFLQLSVCPHGGGACLPMVWGVCVTDTTPSRSDADTPLGRHPPGDGQQAGGTHPTGMYSCFISLSLLP